MPLPRRRPPFRSIPVRRPARVRLWSPNLTALVSGLVRPGLAGDTETITSFVAAKGSARIQANGALSYTSASSGPDTLTYTVADQLGDTATGTVAVTVDGGPVSSGIVSTVKVGTSINLTPLILAASTPGLKGDVLTVTADATSGTAGSVSLVDGVLTYAAVGSGLSHITANGSQTDSVGFTVADQYGDTAQAVAKITITKSATIIKGPLFGLATIQGTSGTDIINASGYFNAINANGGNDVVNAGLGNATVTTSTGDVVTNLAGYLNTVSGGDGRNIVSGSWGLTSVTLGNGNDSVSMGGFANTVRLGNGNDLVKGGQGADEIVLGNGDDSVSENGFFNSVRVGSGTNTIIAGSGLATVVAGGGTDAITLAGTGNNVTLNGSTATVSGGQGADRVTATRGRESLTFAGWNSTADLNGTTVASITDLGNALRVNVGSSTQTDTLTGFGSRDTFGVVDLQNGAGGYTSINAVVAALHSDGHGGTMLALGTTGSIDFANTNANQIHASNFKIG
jgi:RTX calcium-binding nonapeptide repeat (4 copies)